MKKWTLEEARALYNTPLLKLIFEASSLHAQNHRIGEVQIASLISIKTGGCPEDCKYCSQSSAYNTGTPATPLMKVDEVIKKARKAIENGATRICLGASLREVRDSLQFEQILEIVASVAKLGVEVCCTLGMLNRSQAKKLKEAGLYAYNHNLDTSETFYKTIITTRSYQERLSTLDAAENEGLSLCCGGIFGMGESIEDRLQFLLTLANRENPPESVPLNRLIPIPGTPLGKRELLPFWEFLPIVATARLLLPRSKIRLSAGRKGLAPAEQALCFLAGANSIHAGEKLLTAENSSLSEDEQLFSLLGLQRR